MDKRQKRKSRKGRKEKREEGTLILRHFTMFNIFIAADSIGIFSNTHGLLHALDALSVKITIIIVKESLLVLGEIKNVRYCLSFSVF